MSPTYPRVFANAPATNVLLIGGFLYILLCGPAITQRGFPPIDPAWTGMTWLWIFPILLSAAVPRPAFGRHLQELAVYCLVTAFFNAAAVVTDVPKVVELTTTLIMTLVFFGPLHLIAGLLVVAMAAVIRAVTRRIVPGLSPAASKIARTTVFGGLLVLMIAFPFAFREWSFLVERLHAQGQADADWETGTAGLYERPAGTSVEHQYDPATGLKYRDQWRETRFSKAYNQRVHELLAERGIPAWSMQKYLVPDGKLLALLDADDFQEVTEFPHQVNDNIVLIRPAESASEQSGEDALSIAARESGIIQTHGKGPAAVGRRPGHPGVIFIRKGTAWIGAFHESGRLLSSAYRR